jgi:serine/threonine-protein kinase HipA
VVTIGSERRLLRLDHTSEALDRLPGRTPLLSLTLPVSADRFGHGVIRPFLDGLLPEGESRPVIADDLGLRADDTFGLIRALGRDRAGALVIQPGDQGLPPAVTTTAEPLDEAQLGGRSPV